MINIDLEGKRALIMGVTNARSLGWAIADQLRQAGAELAFSYQGERLQGELKKLTKAKNGHLVKTTSVTVWQFREYYPTFMPHHL